MTEEKFKIDPHSKEIIKEFESELRALRQQGKDVSVIEMNREKLLQKLAEKFSSQLWKQYKHIVDYIRNAEYEPAFKYLMLKETLTKTYKKDNKGDKIGTIVKKRDLRESISDQMILNKTTLDIIYRNAESNESFANIYFGALEVFNKTFLENDEVIIDGVETYGKGKWLKFEGKSTNEEEYLKNSEKLASLVANTPWCTRTLASLHLTEGDFFVFVDNEGKPHIAVKMNREEISEVRGIQNGIAQEIEEEYREVAISFLERNKEKAENERAKKEMQELEKIAENQRVSEFFDFIDEVTEEVQNERHSSRGDRISD